METPKADQLKPVSSHGFELSHESRGLEHVQDISCSPGMNQQITYYHSDKHH